MSYSAKYGFEQSLDRLGERGGFGPGEVISFLSQDIVFHIGSMIIEFLEEFGITEMDHTARTNTRELLNEWIVQYIEERAENKREVLG